MNAKEFYDVIFALRAQGGFTFDEAVILLMYNQREAQHEEHMTKLDRQHAEILAALEKLDRVDSGQLDSEHEHSES